VALIIAPTVVEHFDVGGSTLQEMVDILSAREEAGECTWGIGFDYDSVDRSGRAVGLRVNVEITIRMPRWTGRDGASAAEKAEWDRFYRALMEHERGHESRTRSGCVSLHRRLARTLASDLPGARQEEADKIQRTSDAYDVATDHGRRPAPGTIITVP
jgi:predicted secreted Zn-dependent protease